MRSLSHSLPSSLATPWSQAAAIYRRICLLRARGQHAEAARLEQHEFAAANSAAADLAAESSVPGTAERFAALLSAEENRVADALLLAELLAPLLAEHIRPLAPATDSVPPAPAPRESLRPHPPHHPGEPAPSIADLIDSMLGQERGLRPPAR